MLLHILQWPGIAVLATLCILATAANPAHPNPVRHPVAYGYYAEDNPGSWATLQARGHRLAGVITTGFSIDASGNVVGRHDPRIIELVRTRGGSVHARVANQTNDTWSREVAHAILTAPGARAQAMSGVLRLLDLHGYDGIHLMLQNVAPQDRQALTSFVAELSQRIHRRGRTLSIAVPAKISDLRSHEWTGAFDYPALAHASDWVVVLAYDEHWSHAYPRPVTPLRWVESVLRFAARRIPSHKLILGIGFYGYVWSDGPSEMISMREAQRRAKQSRAQILWDEHAQVPFFSTSRETVYFENAHSIELRIILATRFGVAGVALWRLGDESPDVWESLGTFLRSSVRYAAR